eukprot:CAMPEP_0204569886 /NCGR_PEP_ID=MMETSP0661-20131031/38004_1 /ASSEMBLY_ACC=CAM_ASM_000606 /TAXON_ID=109239 /ORGANISM="Alexandrium margalefi, Strain AMGDE01CS-322" /LENGTH=69 /DNA_ID=CAMNT_0051578033 /DNA_START=65 /DNA_END=274 /DNA_ORIENTATION=+
MPMTKTQAVKKELLAALLHGGEEVQGEAARMVSSLAKGKRLGTLDAELAELSKRMAVSEKKEAVKDDAL